MAPQHHVVGARRGARGGLRGSAGSVRGARNRKGVSGVKRCGVDEELGAVVLVLGDEVEGHLLALLCHHDGVTVGVHVARGLAIQPVGAALGLVHPNGGSVVLAGGDRGKDADHGLARGGDRGARAVHGEGACRVSVLVHAVPRATSAEAALRGRLALGVVEEVSLCEASAADGALARSRPVVGVVSAPKARGMSVQTDVPEGRDAGISVCAVPRAHGHGRIQVHHEVQRDRDVTEGVGLRARSSGEARVLGRGSDVQNKVVESHGQGVPPGAWGAGRGVGALSRHSVPNPGLLVQSGVRVVGVHTRLPPDHSRCLLNGEVLRRVGEVHRVVPRRVVHTVELLALVELSSALGAVAAVVGAQCGEDAEPLVLVLLLVPVGSRAALRDGVGQQSSLLQVACEVKLDGVVPGLPVRVRVEGRDLEGGHAAVGRLGPPPGVRNREDGKRRGDGGPVGSLNVHRGLQPESPVVVVVQGVLLQPQPVSPGEERHVRGVRILLAVGVGVLKDRDAPQKVARRDLLDV